MSEAAATPVPQVTARNVRWFVAELLKAGRWMKREELGLEERKARRLSAIARPMVVSFQGSPGYCHISAATDEELEHCIATFRAGARDYTCSANLFQEELNKRQRNRAPAAVQQLLAM